MFKLDTKRLEAVKSGERSEKGCGKTTSMLYSAMKYVAVFNENANVIVAGNNHIPHCTEILCSMLEEIGIKYSRPSKREVFLEKSSASVRFFTREDAVQGIRIPWEGNFEDHYVTERDERKKDV